MARRSRTTPAEAFVQAIALLPWWGCLAIGLIAYVVLHRYAMLPVVMTPGPGQLTGNVFGAIGKGLSGVGQYVIPVLAIAAAVVSFTNRRKRDTLLANATGNQSAEAIASMDWREFEMLTSEAFRLQGFSVTETAKPGADGGVDIVLRKAGETFLVQCKHWRASKVPVETVRELYGLMASHGAAGGFVVTSGRFTDDAKAFAEGRNVRLIDGTKLR